MATPTELLDRATLTTRVVEGWRPRYLFFWGHTERGAREELAEPARGPAGAAGARRFTVAHSGDPR